MCPEDWLQMLMRQVERDPTTAVAAVELVLRDYDGDARLHFLHGSLLASASRLIEAHAALARAVALAPDFALARFQLGLFELTSGEAERALATLAPLEELPNGHYLRHFHNGLALLIADRFADATAAFLAGIAGNTDNLPLNRDMQMLVDRCRAVVPALSPNDDRATSATSLLLGQAAGTVH